MATSRGCAFFLTLGVGLFLAWPAGSEEKAAQKAGKPLLTMYGTGSKVLKAKMVRVTSEKEWQALWAEHKTGPAKANKLTDEHGIVELDFKKVMVVAIFGGKGAISKGYSVHSMREGKKQITLRVDQHPYQIGFRDDPAPGPELSAVAVIERDDLPWGIFVLPRAQKEIVLYEDKRSLIQDPPKWVKWKSFPTLTQGRKSAKRPQ